jgi:hypothetical protein
MSEENGSIQEQPESGVSEATAAAAAFATANNDTVTEVEQPDEPETPEAPEPKRFAGRTEAEIEALLAEIPSMKDGYRKQIDNLAGNYGALKSAFQRLQQDTPQGAAVQATDEDMAALKGEFPELGDMTQRALNNVLKRVNLRGAEIDPAVIDQRVNALVGETISKERVSIHTELLSGLTPGWQDIIGLPDKATGVEPQTEYRKWLATQPLDFQQKIKSSNNAFEIGSSVKAFQQAQESITKKREQNKQRLTNAIQPSGSVAARTAISEQQAADLAFKKGR